MKKTIDVNQYAEIIMRELRKGILLNTNADKFNAMSIGWGALGIVWNRPAFTVYVRDSRYTKYALDKSGEFTLSIPMGNRSREIDKVCGRLSGRDVDKAIEAGLTLEPPQANSVPGIKEYPLTVECRVLYSQRQEFASIPEKVVLEDYPPVEGEKDGSERDLHTAYIGEIVAAYVISGGADGE